MNITKVGLEKYSGMAPVQSVVDGAFSTRALRGSLENEMKDEPKLRIATEGERAPREGLAHGR